MRPIRSKPALALILVMLSLSGFSMIPQTAGRSAARVTVRRGIALLVQFPDVKHTYHLVENRQPVGYDRYLAGSGVLIMYADDRIREALWQMNPADRS